MAQPAAPMHHPPAETQLQQWAGFVSFFIYVLLLKGFLLPLFIIPTGSMAATLNGAHTDMTCPNCGTEYALGVPDLGPVVNTAAQCPNCRWGIVAAHTAAPETPKEQTFKAPLPRKSGDRIIVHGWTYDLGLMFGGATQRWLGPNRWDVVVFKVPNDGQQNYIKRLLGLPGEKIELIDGDVFINDVVATKPSHVQETLWIPVYNHDFQPRQNAQVLPPGYRPRFERVGADGGGWDDAEHRVLRFDGPAKPRGDLRFVTTVDAPQGAESPVAFIDNFYAYNDPRHPEVQAMQRDRVADLRIAADVRVLGGDGYVELLLSHRDSLFIARVSADGRVELARSGVDGVRTAWGESRVAISPSRGTRIALGVADYRVTVAIDGREILASTAAQFSCSPEEAKRLYDLKPFPLIGIAAERIAAELSHVRVDRDVYYTNIFRDPKKPRGEDQSAFNAGCNNPLTLSMDQFFVCGDNSPNSGDCRYWQAPALRGGQPLGPHLQARLQRGEYQFGTVPADQLIGPAFLVYWPGFYPILPSGYDLRIGPVSLSNLLPDIGRLRWIH